MQCCLLLRFVNYANCMHPDQTAWEQSERGPYACLQGRYEEGVIADL